jgi:hypothetical protein
MRILTSLTALLMVLAATAPAHAQPLKAPGGTPGVPGGPKLGQLEVKAYQPIPKTKTAVQLTSDTALARNLRREVMIRLSRRGNDVGFSGGNVMRMDVSYFDFSVGGSGNSGNTIGGNPGYEGPGANPRLELPSNKFEQRNGLGQNLSAPTLRIVLTLYSVDGGKVLWAATSSCATHAGTAENAGTAMIDMIFQAADKSHTGDAGCPL